MLTYPKKKKEKKCPQTKSLYNELINKSNMDRNNKQLTNKQ